MSTRLHFVKDKRLIVFGLCLLIGSISAISMQGCGETPSYFPCGEGFPCAVGAEAANWVCIDGGCHPVDAGTDASDGSVNAIATCEGPCVDLPLDGWNGPRALVYGDTSDPALPTECPDELGSKAFWGHADPVWSPAECDACKCKEATGKCSTLPEKIELHAATCNQAGSSLPFGGPSGWDGSCTNANAIAAGATCPVGSSNLCAQSIATSPLGAPFDEACEAYADGPEVPNASLPQVTWAKTALACHVPQCNGGDNGCIPTIRPLPPAFQVCISRAGIHDCVAPWNHDRQVFYEETRFVEDVLDDKRECSPCACGAPAGSCLAHLRTFEEGACAKLVSDYPISSTGPNCTNVFPVGVALGSAEITPPEYIAGTCAPSGGEPIGAVYVKDKNAVTFCCAAASQ